MQDSLPKEHMRLFTVLFITALILSACSKAPELVAVEQPDVDAVATDVADLSTDVTMSQDVSPSQDVTGTADVTPVSP